MGARGRWGAALLLTCGCGGYGTDAEYAEARAQIECNQIERCALGMYESLYSSEEDCFDDRRDALDAENDALDELSCTYLPDEAAACIRRVRGMSCEDWATGGVARACDLVWRCEENPQTSYTLYGVE